LNRAFSAQFISAEILGRLPQATIDNAPLALNTYETLGYFQQISGVGNVGKVTAIPQITSFGRSNE